MGNAEEETERLSKMFSARHVLFFKVRLNTPPRLSARSYSITSVIFQTANRKRRRGNKPPVPTNFSFPVGLLKIDFFENKQ